MPFGNAVGEGFNNPGTVVAKKVIVEGTNGAVLVYSSAPPALGNLAASVSNGSFTDSVGNSVLGGSVSYTMSLPTLFFANALIGGILVFYTASSAAGPWTVTAEISVNALGILGLSLSNGAVTGTWPQSSTGVTTVAQVVTLLKNLGLAT